MSITSNLRNTIYRKSNYKLSEVKSSSRNCSNFSLSFSNCCMFKKGCGVGHIFKEISSLPLRCCKKFSFISSKIYIQKEKTRALLGKINKMPRPLYEPMQYL